MRLLVPSEALKDVNLEGCDECDRLRTFLIGEAGQTRLGCCFLCLYVSKRCWMPWVIAQLHLQL